MDIIALTMREQQRVAVIERVFRREPTMAKAAWRAVDRTRPVQALCFKYRQVMAMDNTVAFQGAVLPLPKRSPLVSWAQKTVDVPLLLDGSVEVFAQNERLARFDAKTARTIGLHRPNGRREISRYGPHTTTPATLCVAAP